MRKNKILMFTIIIIIVSLIVYLGYILCTNIKKEDEILEYIPEEEISDKQLRMTNIELYFINKENGEIEREIRNIDAKNLIDKPIEFVIAELIKGPKNEAFEGVIPKDTALNNIEFIDGILCLNFNENLINNESKTEKICESLKKTLDQFVEINEIKIMVNGTEMKQEEEI